MATLVGGDNHGDFFSPSARMLGTIKRDTIHLWDTKNWNELTSVASEGLHPCYLAFTPDERYLAASGAGGIAVWKFPDGPEETPQMELVKRIKIPRNVVTSSVRYSPDGQYLAAVCFGGDLNAVRLWRTATFEEVPGPTIGVPANYADVQFFPDGKHLVYASRQGMIEIWNIADARRARGTGNPGAIHGGHIALSPDGRWLATNTADAQVSLWNTETGEKLATLPGRRNSIWCMAWSPDHRLGVGFANGEAVIWDVPNIWRQLDKIGLAWEQPPGKGATYGTDH